MKRIIKNELDRSMILGYIQRLDLHKEYRIVISEKKMKRSLSQNALYWLFLTCIEFETGNDRYDLHDEFKERYLEPKKVIVLGKEKNKYSTADLNTTQFKYYLDHIQQFAATELSITLPDPEDKYWEDFYLFYVDKL